MTPPMLIHAGPALGARQRSRLSVGGRPLGASPDPGFPTFDPALGPPAFNTAPLTPPIPAPPPSSARVGPGDADETGPSAQDIVQEQRGLAMPYTQRLQVPGTCLEQPHLFGCKPIQFANLPDYSKCSCTPCDFDVQGTACSPCFLIAH